MKSIGDFAINITPNVNTVALNTGITALDSLSNLAGKVYDGLKKAYNVVDETADSMFGLVDAARQLDQPIDKVDTFRKALRLMSIDASAAYGALKTIGQIRGGVSFGKVIDDAIIQAGIIGTAIPKDPEAAFKYIQRKYQSTKNLEVRKTLSGLFPGVERGLATPMGTTDKYWEMARKQAIHPTDIAGVEHYKALTGELKNTREQFEVELMRSTLPALIDVMKRLTDVLQNPDFINSVKSIANSLIGMTGGAITTTGKVLSFTQRTAQESKEVPFFEHPFKRFQLGLKHGLEGTAEGFRTLFGSKAGVPEVNVLIQNNSDGTSIDTKVTQQNNVQTKDTNINSERKDRVGM